MDLNKIYNENCLETMSRMPDGFVDLVLTSPPYDKRRVYNGYSFPFQKIAQQLYRVLKNGGVLVWNVNDQVVNGSESLTSFRQAIYFNKIGFNVHDTMLYGKKNVQAHDDRGKRYKQAFEYVFILSKGTPATFNPIKDDRVISGNIKGMTSRKENGEMRVHPKEIKTEEYQTRKNIWFYHNGFNLTTKDKIAFEHPAIMNENLCKDHIFSWSNEGDLVYDPFMGIGTTAKMAHLQKRKWVGSEISAEYVALAEKRLFPYLNQTTLF